MTETATITELFQKEIKDVHDRFVRHLAFGNRNEKSRAMTVLDETITMAFRIARDAGLDQDEFLTSCGVDVEQWNNRYGLRGVNKYRS